jgi:hypothetical protein
MPCGPVQVQAGEQKARQRTMFEAQRVMEQPLPLEGEASMAWAEYLMPRKALRRLTAMTLSKSSTDCRTFSARHRRARKTHQIHNGGFDAADACYLTRDLPGRLQHDKGGKSDGRPAGRSARW